MTISSRFTRVGSLLLGLIVLIGSGQDNFAHAHSAPKNGHSEEAEKHPGYLNGNWNLTEVSSIGTEKESKVDDYSQDQRLLDPVSIWLDQTFSRRLKTGMFRVQLNIQDDSGSFELILNRKADTPSCSVTLKYDVAYCCPEMQKIFLSRVEDSLTESVEGCVEQQLGITSHHLESFIDQWVESDYKFNFQGSSKKQVSLDGPYQEPRRRLNWERAQNEF